MSSPEPVPIVQMANITRRFGDVVANANASLAVWEGEIHAVIGENGAGKSTLVNILFGRVQPDAGRIRLRGVDVQIDSPATAIALGLGMVTQHTTLIPALTALENVILGAEPAHGGVIDRQAARQKVGEIGERLGVTVSWDSPAGSLSVAALQKAEVVKAIYRGARILILDEPTATLAPQEADALFALLHSLTASGATVIFITHKLREVMAHSRHVTVLQAGMTVGERETRRTSPEELAGLMLGQRTASPGVDLRGVEPELPAAEPTWVPPAPSAAPPVPTLEVRGVTVLNARRAPAVRDLSLEVRPGEVVGVAGVDGSGQRELAEAVVGLRAMGSGSIWLDGKDVTRWSVADRLSAGLSFVPEDRQREGLILDFSVAENLLLGRQRDWRFGGGRVLSPSAIDEHARGVIAAHRVRASGPDVPARALSGGNQQKLAVARALEGEPRVLVAMQPTRGLDVEATRLVYDRLRQAQKRGLGILLFSLDLDEVFEISDRIAVMYNGELAGVVARSQATPETVGAMMLTGRPAEGALP